MDTRSITGVLSAAAIATTLTFDASTAAHAYPTQTTQLTVGYDAGGGTDMCFRALARTLNKELGQSVVVNNRQRNSPSTSRTLSIPRNLLLKI